jgi:hypothetical protein
MIRRDSSTDTQLDLEFPSGTISVPYTTILGVPPPDPGAQEVLDGIRDWLYSQLGTRTRLNQLPQGDPDRTADPGREGLFWDETVNPTELVSRPYIITVTWDGTKYQYSFRAAS